jgi:hypothetical protein
MKLVKPFFFELRAIDQISCVALSMRRELHDIRDIQLPLDLQTSRWRVGLLTIDIYKRMNHASLADRRKERNITDMSLIYVVIFVNKLLEKQ